MGICVHMLCITSNIHVRTYIHTYIRTYIHTYAQYIQYLIESCCPCTFSLLEDSLVDGVASVLEVLHVDILSVGGQCRRAECQDGGNCTHVNTFQPDIAGEFGETSFVIKCVLYHYDGTIIDDHVKTLNDVRKRMGLSLGLLVYDQTDGTPQVLSQQIPPNCTLVPVDAFKWDCQWVRSTLLALYGGLCTPLTAETSPPTQEGVGGLCTPLTAETSPPTQEGVGGLCTPVTAETSPPTQEDNGSSDTPLTAETSPPTQEDVVYTEVKIDNPPRKPPALENVVYLDVKDIGEKAVSVYCACSRLYKYIYSMYV